MTKLETDYNMWPRIKAPYLCVQMHNPQEDIDRAEAWEKYINKAQKNA